MSSEMLYQVLRQQVQSGTLEVGTAMPSEAALCAEYQLARGTVRAALQRLADEGYLRTGQGRKRIVQRRQPLQLARLRLSSKYYNEPPVHSTRSKSQRPSPSFGEYLRSLNHHPADIVLRSATNAPCSDLKKEPRFQVETQVPDALNISSEGRVHWFLRLRMADDEPVALQWAVVAAKLLPDLSLDFLVPGGLTQLYERRGIERDRVRSSYCPTRASKSEATFLRVGTSAPLIEERRVSYYRNAKTKKEESYEYLLTLYPERIALTFEWRDLPHSPVAKQQKKSRR